MRISDWSSDVCSSDLSGKVARLVSNGTPLAAEIERAGALEDMLIWRFHGAEGLDLAGSVAGLIAGPTGDRLAGSGIMVALVSAEGRIRAANRVFRARADRKSTRLNSSH